MKPRIVREVKTKTGVTLTLLAGGLDDSPEEQARPQGPPLLPMVWIARQLELAKLERARRALEEKRAKQARAKVQTAPQATRAAAEKPPVRAKSRAQVYFMRCQLERLRQGLPLEIKGRMSVEEIQAMAETPLDGLPERVA